VDSTGSLYRHCEVNDASASAVAGDVLDTRWLRRRCLSMDKKGRLWRTLVATDVEQALTMQGMSRPRRIAFVTDEYPSTLPNAGGLATYVQRMARLLHQMGHTVEVFVRSNRQFTYADGGVLVHEVPPLDGVFGSNSTLASISWRIDRHLPATRVFRELDMSAGLARAVEMRERENEFDLVQSSDFQFRGVFVRRGRRPHVVRCSWARDLFQRVDGTGDKATNALFAWLERMSIRRASAAYAPSDLVSRYYRKEFGLEVGVVRPPMFDVRQDAEPLSVEVPARYLLHFGSLCRRKGSDVVAAALTIAWKTAPDLRMVWAGRQFENLFSGLEEEWGARTDQVQWLGAVSRGQLATLLQGAAASVLPSRCDNLPNTVIESLMAGVPVIGTHNSSIDELVVHEKNGLLVPIGDADELAAAMIRVWRGDVRWRAGHLPPSPIHEEMQPAVAARKLLAFAR
jgi:glycosyltransferase involved in cell wall biosynthesis